MVRNGYSLLYALAALGFLFSTPLSAQPVWENETVLSAVPSKEVTFDLTRVVGGLRNPWAVAFLPDERMLVTERRGRLWLIDGESVAEVDGLPRVREIGQGGLMDVVLHPAYADNGWLYLTYTADYNRGQGTRLVRARLDGTELVDLEQLFEMTPPGRGRVHFGSRVAFDADGYLFMTLGERGDRDRAQELNSHHGTVIRLRDDGSVPDGNPFEDRDGALPEIWSHGHRNAQGLFYDGETGRLWLHEHGPRGGDTLHVVKRGANYGWPVATYGDEYRGGSIGTTPDAMDDIVNPRAYWVPTSIAPSGLTLYRGDAFPEWEGDLFIGALVQRHLRRVVLKGEDVVHQEVLLRDEIGRIRDVRTGPDGALWILTDARRGGLYRLSPAEGD